MLAVAAGSAFATGTNLQSYVLYQYDYPIFKLAPMLGANAAVPVLVGLIFLAEAGSVDTTRLLIGMLLTLFGIMLVTTA